MIDNLILGVLKTRAITISFILFLVAIVIIADTGNGIYFWPFIHSIPAGDNFGHICLFFTLSFLCNLSFAKPTFGNHPFQVTLTTLVLLTVITLEEFSQAFIPARSFDILDWVSNLIGLGAGQFAAWRRIRLKQTKQSLNKTIS